MKGLACAFSFAFLLFGVFSPDVRSQELPVKIKASPMVATPTRLVDTFGKLSAEDRSARFDVLLQEISRTPNSIGYVFLYCGRQCRYGEIEAHQRGIEIKIALRHFERDRIVVLNAGFRDRFETELWLAGEPGTAPRPRSTVNIRFVDFAKPTKRMFEPYDCCDDFSDVWRNIKL